MIKAITSDQAPAAIGPYSQAVLAGNVLYMSGQIALDPKTGEMVGTSVEQQTRQVLKNMSAVLASAGLELKHLVQCTIYLASMDDFAVVNQIYADHIANPTPTRGTIAVKTLPKNALVEIVGIAHVPQQEKN